MTLPSTHYFIGKLHTLSTCTGDLLSSPDGRTSTLWTLGLIGPSEASHYEYQRRAAHIAYVWTLRC